MNKNKTLITALGLIVLSCVMLMGLLLSGSDDENDTSVDSSSQILIDASVSDSSDASDESEAAHESSATVTVTEASSSEEAVTTEQEEAKTYSFRSQKLFDQHFEKHGAEFGNITKEDYLRMANELINSESETVLSKTEKEDGDYVFFDTEKGWFAVLSTDGYIRTFFIPDHGIKYYNKQ